MSHLDKDNSFGRFKGQLRNELSKPVRKQIVARLGSKCPPIYRDGLEKDASDMLSHLESSMYIQEDNVNGLLELLSDDPIFKPALDVVIAYDKRLPELREIRKAEKEKEDRYYEQLFSRSRAAEPSYNRYTSYTPPKPVDTDPIARFRLSRRNRPEVRRTWEEFQTHLGGYFDNSTKRNLTFLVARASVDQENWMNGNPVKYLEEHGFISKNNVDNLVDTIVSSNNGSLSSLLAAVVDYQEQLKGQ
jgi:hypothetical protein